ncbi:hypothetical protein HS088_TW06G00074 [Tripterygium wilfordii]|uniref:Uncharacterized protein n=1 Tax=Tripterygium wilfordii TaxID=458696 RepID=A0A7J7DHZ7_TRIWF|nr:hypothetical protein HS088_TW06G00074 [Tripterygium wilfordii]
MDLGTIWACLEWPKFCKRWIIQHDLYAYTLMRPSPNESLAFSLSILNCDHQEEGRKKKKSEQILAGFELINDSCKLSETRKKISNTKFNSQFCWSSNLES